MEHPKGQESCPPGTPWWRSVCAWQWHPLHGVPVLYQLVKQAGSRAAHVSHQHSSRSKGRPGSLLASTVSSSFRHARGFAPVSTLKPGQAPRSQSVRRDAAVHSNDPISSVNRDLSLYVHGWQKFCVRVLLDQLPDAWFCSVAAKNVQAFGSLFPI